MEYFHLTTPQKNIWNLQKYYSGSAVANLCGAVFFQERRDTELLCQAVRLFIRNQSGIRLRFEDGDEPGQYVSDEVDEEIPVRVFRSRKELDAYAERCARNPIGLANRQMYRFTVFHLEQENRSGILPVLSHLISDAWTFGLMANQLDAAYRKLAGEEGVTLLEGNYVDFIWSEEAYLASERYGKDKNYWEGKYPFRPEECPVKLRNALVDNLEAGRITRILPLSLEQGIEMYCRNHSVTEAVLFETALVVYLSRINPEIQAVTVGVPVLNRSNAREKEIAGMFVSTMPFTVAVAGDMEILGMARQIAREHMDLFRHQKYSYAHILRRLREKQQFSGNLYDVIISYQNAKTKTMADTRWYFNGCSEVPLAIHIDNRDGKGCHTINADFQRAVFQDEAEVELLLDRLEYILGQIVEEDIKRINEAEVVTTKEYDKIVHGFNDTNVDYPRERCIHELFMEQATITPERVALVFEERQFTYRQLDEMSNSLAHFLREKGIGPEDVVPIIARRSWHVIVAMLGVLKAGGAYMLVDYQYPTDRIMYLVQECKADIVLVYGCKYTNAVDLENIDYYNDIESIKLKNEINDTFCVIHTSGSTGMPKVTALSHENIVHCINYSEDFFRGVVQAISTTIITFDAFVLETIVPLCRQVPVILLSEIQSNQNEFEKVVEKYNDSFLFQTPTKLQSYIRNSSTKKFLLKIASFVIGGEVFPQELYDTIQIYNPNSRLYNGYGPTETTLCVAFKELRKSANITIGTPIANTQIYILDSRQSPVPIGTSGELYIAGEGVGKGYLNRPELTAERFVPNPFASTENGHGKIMYRTGDLARFRSDGQIEYLGRMDTQVKIRGLRIELGEIESVMGSFSGIGLCAVADKRDETGRQYLVGYYTVVADTGKMDAVKEETGCEMAASLDEKALRAHLSTKLPKYMVPNYFMQLEAMPMTASGKTDRKNLPSPDFVQQTAGFVPLETEIEKRLAEIWQKLLHVRRVGKTDDFFDLGGDSLLAITMLSEIEKVFHMVLSVRDVMEHSELEVLAQCLEVAYRAEGSDMADGDEIERNAVRQITVHHANRYPLLPQQKAIYAACIKEPDALTYNMPAKIILPYAVNRDRLKESISQILNRHKQLRSYIHMDETGFYGIYDENARIVFEEYEMGKEGAFLRPFDLGKAPLVRVGFTEEALLFDMHHIIADGVSMDILLREIATVYGGGRLSERGAEYSDYAEYFYHLDMGAHKAYFRKELKCDWMPVMLPETKKPGKGGKSRLYQVPEEVFLEVRKYARENGLTDTMVFLGAYGILLSKYTGRNEILSSIVLQNRMHVDTKDIVGMFVNTLPLSLTLKEDELQEDNVGTGGSVATYMQEVKEKLLGLFRYQELPFGEISEVAGMNDRSVINTSFVYQGDGKKTLFLEGQELTPQFMDTHTSKFDLSMEITPAEDGCRLRLEYNLTKYDDQLMDALAESYICILKQLRKEKLADISVLPEEEYRRIVEGFNDTYVDYPRGKCVHELFSEQAAKVPERMALVFEDGSFTYRQLDDMSNSLARFLREKGIRPGNVVPIIGKRSWHIIVAMLGVLKAGGAYMLIDYQYPADRISYLVRECSADIVLTYGCRYVDSIDLGDVDYVKGIEAIESLNEADDILCVIHTSGSTGVPKVAALSHENMAHFIHYSETLFGGIRQTIAATAITFDAFILETMVSMCRQVPIILLSEMQMTDQKEFEKIVNRYQYSFMFQTPTKLQNYIRNSKKKEFLSKIACFVIGGEVFPQELYDAIRVYNFDGRIYNIYGPTETTVCVTVNELREGADITIGTPIDNTQIYILDDALHPVPIGVPGELCIAGEGVGKGYLNRPELTAERFMQNPFATAQNRHGKVMYRTGDLARFRNDGEIEYLGRMDTQVKIRGLRIELGEIESVMGSFTGIGQCTVAEKRDETGRQYLVGYYTVDSDEGGLERGDKALRAHLSAKLPKYMVPNYFMRLETMPMTVSGKMDRRNLPLPDFAQSAREYVPPVTEKEKILCSLMKELLHVTQVGVTDDFFELGGDSLTAIEFLAKAHDSGIVFALQNVFDYPTVEQLCRHMEAGNKEKIHYEPADFDKYQTLLARNVMDEAFVPRRRFLGNVLLTGATGFLGAHVLDKLLQEKTGKVYCLVRDGEKPGSERLRETLRYYFGNRYEAESDIIPIVGDIESEGLAEEMPEDVQTVIHTAASVKHYGAYDYFHRVNVEGTRHVVSYTKAVGARLIHISTLSVSGNSLADEFAVYRSEEEKFFAETSLYIGQPLDNVYIHSKFEAEIAVLDAMLEGLDAKIVRVGNLTSRATDYKFQPNYRQNAFLTRVKAILEFGLFPDYLMPLYAEFSPIDLTADGVVKIAQYADGQTVFHLNSNRPIYFDRFLEVVQELGISMKVVDSDTFNRALRGTIRDRVTEYIFEAFQNDMDEQGRLLYDSNIHIENDFTTWFLEKLGFVWNKIDMEYIRGYMEYYRKIGYMEV